MDLHVVFIILQELILLNLPFHENMALQVPTEKYSKTISSREAKKDFKQRRKQLRRQNAISLKPPPEDWPEPTMGIADFMIMDGIQSTSLSPLLAYQAKLEQELLKQNEEDTLRTREESKKSSDSSVWTSSQEDFKKLLNPNELLKHNKQLKPYVNPQGKTKKMSRKLKSTVQQGKGNVKHEDLKSHTAVKIASAGSKKTKRKSKLVVSKIPVTSGRRSKTKETVQELSDDLTPLKISKKRKVKLRDLSTEVKKTKESRPKARKFTFAAAYPREYETNKIERTAKKSSPFKITTSVPTLPIENVSPTTQSCLATSLKTTKGSSKSSKKTKKIKKQGTGTFETKTTRNPLTSRKVVIPNTTTHNLKEMDQISVKTTMDSNFCLRNIPTSISLIQSIPITTNKRRNEIREKRKKIRQKMKEVIKIEDLEGSFSDRDSNWTSSEKGRFPILDITPRYALESILKHKIMSVIESVLEKTPESADDEDKLDE